PFRPEVHDDGAALRFLDHRLHEVLIGDLDDVRACHGHQGSNDAALGGCSRSGPSYGMILEIGSSRMSLAPRAFSCGSSWFTHVRATSVSTACPRSSAWRETVGDFMEGRTARTRSTRSASTFSLMSTRSWAINAPMSSVHRSSTALRRAGSAAASREAMS